MDIAVTAQLARARFDKQRLRTEKSSRCACGYPVAQEELEVARPGNRNTDHQGWHWDRGYTEKALRQFEKQGLQIKIGLRCESDGVKECAGNGVGLGFETPLKPNWMTASSEFSQFAI
jgi:hypothetical protein